VRLLIDTHVFLWWDVQPDRVFPLLAHSIRDEGTEVFVSVASVWEIAIKRAAGRLGFDRPVCGAIAAHGFNLLAITGEHAEHAGTLPRHHGESAVEGMVLGTQDPKLAPYGIAMLGLCSG
jgi:PIN domain nuclease of toxin-antitoxin system